MKFKGNLEALVLGALSEGPLHGYAIARRIEASGALKMGENQLYPTLHKLEAEGSVQSDWQPQEGKPPRKVYALTESGKTALSKLRADWKHYAQSMGAILGLSEAGNA